MKSPILVALAEDHEIMRQGLISLLKEEENIKVLFDVSNGKELLDRVSHYNPDIVLLDIDMPVMNGEEALDRLSELHPEIKVIMLTQHFSAGHIVNFMRKGARAFLPKRDSVEKIIEAIESVFKYGFYHDNAVKEIIEAEARIQDKENGKIIKAGLTNREVEILKLLREGKSNAEIAKKYNIAELTVKWHRQNLLHKLKCVSAEDLINWSKKNLF